MSNCTSRLRLHEIFEKTAALFPSNTAVEFWDDDFTKHTLSYKEVQESAFIVKGKIESCNNVNLSKNPKFPSNKIKTNAVQHLSSVDFAVGMYTSPSVYLPSIMIGILQAGCHFVPMNPCAPRAVNNKLVESLKLKYIITYKSLLEKFMMSFSPASLQTSVIRLGGSEKFELIFCTFDDFEHDLQNRKSNLAYTLCTSGTTGTPKIVKVPHECIVPNILDFQKIFHVSSTDRVVMCSPLTFDPSIVEIFTTLYAGATLVIVSDTIKIKPSDLVNVLFEKCKITIMQCTPSLISRFNADDLTQKIFSEESELRILAFGGESCPSCRTIRSWFDPKILNKKEMKVRFFNLYGITEVSSWATCYEIPKDKILYGHEGPIPLGFPLRDTSLDILNEQLRKLCSIEPCDSVELKVSAISNANQVTDNSKVKITFFINPCKTNDLFNVQGYLRIGGSKRICYLDNCGIDNVGSDVIMRDTGDLVNFTFTCKNTSFMNDDVTFPIVLETDNSETFGIFYMGRSDGQIKRQGKRMNVLHVKHVLEKNDLVSVAHVMPVCYDEDQFISYQINRSSVNNTNKLIAFVVLTDGAEGEHRKTIWKYLKNNLEVHYIPDELVFIKEMSITSHGKIDEKALIDHFNHPRIGSLPHSVPSIYSIVRRCWDNALSMKFDQNELEISSNSKSIKNLNEDFNMKENFVACGGDSFAAVKLVSMLQEEFAAVLPSHLPEILEKILQGSFEEVIRVLSFLVETDGADKDLLSSKPYTNPISKQTRKRYWKQEDLVLEDNHKIAAHKIKRDVTNQPELTSQSFISFSRGGLKRHHGNPNTSHDQILNINPTCSNTIAANAMFTLEEFWHHNTWKCVDASPLVIIQNQTYTAGFVVIGSHSFLLSCVKLANGGILWQTKLGGRIESSACMTSCGNYIVVGCYDKCVYALEAQSGSIVWKLPTGGEVKSSPCAGQSDSSIVYVGSHDGYLYCLDIQNIKVKWKYFAGGGAIFSSPSFHSFSRNENKAVVYACTLAGKVLCLNADDGGLSWSIEVGKPLFSSPICCNDGLFVGCVDNSMYMLSHPNGSTIWIYATEQPIFSSPSVAILNSSMEGNDLGRQVVIFGSHDGRTYCVDSSKKELVWRYPDTEFVDNNSPVYATPYTAEVMINEKKASIVATASTDGQISILNLQNGRCIARLKLPGHVFSSPVVIQNTISSRALLMVPDAKEILCDIMVGCRNDNLYCLRLNVTSSCT